MASGDTPRGFSFEDSFMARSTPNCSLTWSVLRPGSYGSSARMCGGTRNCGGNNWIYSVDSQYTNSIFFAGAECFHNMARKTKERRSGTLVEHAYRVMKHGILRGEFP